jgi:hypothetical protein
MRAQAAAVRSTDTNSAGTRHNRFEIGLAVKLQALNQTKAIP